MVDGRKHEPRRAPGRAPRARDLRELRNHLRMIAQRFAREFAVFVGTTGAGPPFVMHGRFGMRLDVMRAIAGGAGPVAACALVLLATVAAPQRVLADGEPEAVLAHERCATRLSIAFLGKSPTVSSSRRPTPRRGRRDAPDPVFIERFARFTNSQFNAEPGETARRTPSYTLAKFVLADKKPWKEMFVGAYAVTYRRGRSERPRLLPQPRVDEALRRQ